MLRPMVAERGGGRCSPGGLTERVLQEVHRALAILLVSIVACAAAQPPGSFSRSPPGRCPPGVGGAAPNATWEADRPPPPPPFHPMSPHRLHTPLHIRPLHPHTPPAGSDRATGSGAPGPRRTAPRPHQQRAQASPPQPGLRAGAAHHGHDAWRLLIPALRVHHLVFTAAAAGCHGSRAATASSRRRRCSCRRAGRAGAAAAAGRKLGWRRRGRAA
jgi:hypothetical protein